MPNSRTLIYLSAALFLAIVATACQSAPLPTESSEIEAGADKLATATPTVLRETSTEPPPTMAPPTQPPTTTAVPQPTFVRATDPANDCGDFNSDQLSACEADIIDFAVVLDESTNRWIVVFGYSGPVAVENLEQCVSFDTDQDDQTGDTQFGSPGIEAQVCRSGADEVFYTVTFSSNGNFIGSSDLTGEEAGDLLDVDVIDFVAIGLEAGEYYVFYLDRGYLADLLDLVEPDPATGPFVLSGYVLEAPVLYDATGQALPAAD